MNADPDPQPWWKWCPVLLGWPEALVPGRVQLHPGHHLQQRHPRTGRQHCHRRPGCQVHDHDLDPYRIRIRQPFFWIHIQNTIWIQVHKKHSQKIYKIKKLLQSIGRYNFFKDFYWVFNTFITVTLLTTGSGWECGCLGIELRLLLLQPIPYSRI